MCMVLEKVFRRYSEFLNVEPRYLQIFLKKPISPGNSYEYYIKVIIYDFQKHL